MPIHVPAISRRKFLTRALAAGAALAVNQNLFATSRKRDRDFWALLSDTHLASERSQAERGIKMADNFQRVSTEILGLATAPAGLVITGDCAFNSGQKGDYATLSQLLTPIRDHGIPIHLALGNHDHRERFWEALQQQKLAKRPVADRQVALLRTPRVNWFILDSLETTLSTPGLLGQEQLHWLASALDANAKKPAVVMVHHNPWLNGNLGLKDTPAFFEVIRPRTQVKAYVYGHTHSWKVDQDSSGIHLINLPPVAYVFRQGDPSGWVQARVSSEGMRLELRCIDNTHKAHGEIVDLKWRA